MKLLFSTVVFEQANSEKFMSLLQFHFGYMISSNKATLKDKRYETMARVFPKKKLWLGFCMLGVSFYVDIGLNTVSSLKTHIMG